MKLARPLIVALLTFAVVVSAVAVAATIGTAAGTGIASSTPATTGLAVDAGHNATLVIRTRMSSWTYGSVLSVA